MGQSDYKHMPTSLSDDPIEDELVGIKQGPTKKERQHLPVWSNGSGQAIVTPATESMKPKRRVLDQIPGAAHRPKNNLHGKAGGSLKGSDRLSPLLNPKRKTSVQEVEETDGQHPTKRPRGLGESLVPSSGQNGPRRKVQNAPGFGSSSSSDFSPHFPRPCPETRGGPVANQLSQILAGIPDHSASARDRMSKPFQNLDNRDKKNRWSGHKDTSTVKKEQSLNEWKLLTFQRGERVVRRETVLQLQEWDGFRLSDDDDVVPTMNRDKVLMTTFDGDLHRFFIHIKSRRFNDNNRAMVSFTLAEDADRDLLIQAIEKLGARVEHIDNSEFSSKASALDSLSDKIIDTLNQPKDKPSLERRREEHHESQRKIFNRLAKPKKLLSESKEAADTAASKTFRVTRSNAGMARVEIPVRKAVQAAESNHVSRKPIFKLPPKWKQPLLYPFEGPRRETVDYEDLSRLDEEEFLNDNLINFYMRYLEDKLHNDDPQRANETHFFNTFFYAHLAKNCAPGKSFNNVLKWTSKVDIFKKNYIIIPINESSHWYLAIICNLQHLERRLKIGHMPSVGETKELDSDATMSEGAPAEQISQKEDPMEIDSEAPAEASEKLEQAREDVREGVAKMAIDEKSVSGPETDEWPSEDETEHLNPELEKKNESARIPKPNLEGGPKQTRKRTRTKAPRRDKNYSLPDTPAIVVLDSMSSDSRRPKTVKNLKEWLRAEAQSKRGLDAAASDFKALYPKAPSQNNWYDCGPYVLYYAERFLERAPQFVSYFLTKELIQGVSDPWDAPTDMRAMRVKLYDTIVGLHTEYENQQTRKVGARKSNRGAMSPLHTSRERCSDDVIMTSENVKAATTVKSSAHSQEVTTDTHPPEPGKATKSPQLPESRPRGGNNTHSTLEMSHVEVQKPLGTAPETSESLGVRELAAPSPNRPQPLQPVLGIDTTAESLTNVSVDQSSSNSSALSSPLSSPVTNARSESPLHAKELTDNTARNLSEEL